MVYCRSSLLWNPSGGTTPAPLHAHGTEFYRIRVKSRNLLQSAPHADFSDTRKLLLDSAAVLREAAVQHLLAFEVVRRLYTSVAKQHVLPRADPQLVFLVQLLQLGTAAPAIACGHHDAPRMLPAAPPAVLHVLLPILAGIIIDSRCGKVRLHCHCKLPLHLKGEKFAVPSAGSSSS